MDSGSVQAMTYQDAYRKLEEEANAEAEKNGEASK